MLILIKYSLKNYFRDWEAIFWTVIFPLIFLVLFKYVGSVVPSDTLFVEDYSEKLGYFDLVVPGIIGFAIAQSQTTSVAINITTFREKNIFKRIAATPLPIWKYIFGIIITHIVIIIFQITMMLIISKFFLQTNLGYQLAILTYFYGVLGGIIFINFGLISGSITKTPKAANGVASGIVFIMLFISDIFFSAESLPRAINLLADISPLRATVSLLRATAIGDLIFVPKFWEEISLLVLWITFTSILVVKLFSFGDRKLN